MAFLFMFNNPGNNAFGDYDWKKIQQIQIQPQGCYPYPTIASACSGDVHVFPCAYAESCKCGKTSRKVTTACPHAPKQ